MVVAVVAWPPVGYSRPPPQSLVALHESARAPCLHLVGGHLDRQRQIVEAPGVGNQSGVAAALHAIDDLRDTPHKRGLIPRTSGQEPLDAPRL